MRDAVAEVRYQALRTKLNDLNYYQPFGLESCILVERLLKDLIDSIERTQALKKRSEERAERLRICGAELDVLRLENPRLQEENNALHLELIEAGETTERLEADVRLQLRALEDEYEAVQLALQQVQHANAKREAELHALREKALSSLLRKENTGPTGDQAEGGSGLAREASSRARTLPDVASRRLVPGRAAEQLKAKLQCLQDALRDCEARTRKLTASTKEEARLATELEEEAAAAGIRLAEEGPDIAALSLKAEASRRNNELAETEEAIEQRRTECAMLQQDCSRLNAEHVEKKKEAASLERRVADLRVEEKEVAEQLGRVQQVRQEHLRENERKLEQANELSSQVREKCRGLASTRQRLLGELGEVSRTCEVEERANAKRISALTAEIEEQRREFANERVHFGAETKRLAEQVEEANSAEAEAEEVLESLSSETNAAEVVCQACVQSLTGRSAEMQEMLLGGAKLQQTTQRSAAQLQLLGSSFKGLQGEKELLVAHLKDAETSLRTESLECVELKLQTQRLSATVASLDGTEKEWKLDFDRTTASLKRAHGQLNAARKRCETARQSHLKLVQKEFTLRESEAAASEQRDELSAEISEWGAESTEEQRHCRASREVVQEARARLSRLEDEARTARQVRKGEEQSALLAIRGLREALASATSEERIWQNRRDEQRLRLTKEVVQAEDTMTQMNGELQDMLARHDHMLAQAALQQKCESDEQERAKAFNGEVEQESRELQRVEEATRRGELELRAAEEEEQVLQQKVAALQSQLDDCGRQASEVARLRSAHQAALERHQAEQHAAEAAESTVAAELNVAKARLETMVERCDRFRKDAEDLVALVENAEASREALGSELRQRRQELDEEHARRTTLESAATGWAEEQSEAVVEVEALRQAAFEVDAERDGRQSLADLQSEEIDDIRREIVAQQQGLIETRQMVDGLRDGLKAGAARLAEQRWAVSSREQEAEELACRSIRLRDEAREETAAAAGVFDDLMHMTKENQSLHEEMRILEQRVTALASNARDYLATQELGLQQVRAIEMERDDITRLHHVVAQQTRHQMQLLERLRAEARAARGQTAELQAEMALTAKSEEDSQARNAQIRLDISVTENQLTDLTERHCRAEQSHREALAEDARLEGDVAAAAMLCKGADQREAVRTHAMTTLGMRRQQLEASIKQARAEVAANRRLAQEGREQVLHLEQLVEEERRRSALRAAENESLRRLQASTEGQMTPPRRTLQVSPGRFGSSHGQAVSAAALKEEVDRRYAEVGELDAQQQSLSSEAQRLRRLLRERRAV